MSDYSAGAESYKTLDADIARIKMQPQSIEAERSVIGGFCCLRMAGTRLPSWSLPVIFTDLNIGLSFVK